MLQNSGKKSLLVFSRILIATLFLVAGLRKLTAFAATVAYFSKLGLPAPELVAGGVICLEVIGAICIIFGWRMRLIAVAFGLFSVITGLLAHQFWLAEPSMFSNQLNNFLKNLSLAGAFLWIALHEPTNSKD